MVRIKNWNEDWKKAGHSDLNDDRNENNENN